MSGVPAPWVPAPPREVLSVRIRPDLKLALEGYVTAMRGQGWDLQTRDVLEHLLRDLLTEEGRETLTRELEQAGR